VLLHSAEPCTQFNRRDQVLELAGPQPIVLIEWVLVSHGLQAENLLLLGIDFRSRIVQDGFDYFQVSNT